MLVQHNTSDIHVNENEYLHDWIPFSFSFCHTLMRQANVEMLIVFYCKRVVHNIPKIIKGLYIYLCTYVVIHILYYIVINYVITFDIIFAFYFIVIIYVY